jgi:lantibiotic modifying enzyme
MSSFEHAQECLDVVLYKFKHIANPNTNQSLFDGRAGYLYALVLLRSKLGPQLRQVNWNKLNEYIKETIEIIMESGKKAKVDYLHEYPQLEGSPFFWPQSAGLIGCSFGLSGIILSVMQAPREYWVEYDTEIIAFLAWLQTQKHPDGQYKVRIQEVEPNAEEDENMAFENGISGIALLFLTASKVFDNALFMREATDILPVLNLLGGVDHVGTYITLIIH